MKHLYRQKRDRLIASLKTGLISDRIRIVGEDAGLHFLMEINADLHEKDVINAAQEAGIRIDGLSETALVPLQEKACTLVLGYSGLTDVEQAADALKQVIDKLIH